MNPFIITGDVPKEYFCDREAESDRIVRAVTGGENLCLISQRRLGKSKLIRFCYDRDEVSDSFYTFYVDILHTASLREFTYEFGQTVFTRLRSASRKMLQSLVQGLKSINAEFGFDPASGQPVFSLGLGDISRPEYTLTEIFQCLEQADRPCVVTFDEFQQIGKYPEKNIEALLRSHIQHLGNVHFIFSGSEINMISQMFLSSARPFYHSASMLELKPIAIDKYSDFVIRHFERDGKKVSPEAVGTVYRLFEGNTYCMQKTFHEAYETVAKGEECTVPILRQTVDSVLEEAAAGYRLMLSGIPVRQKELLYAVAEEVRAEKIMGADFLRRHSLASSSSVQTAADKLVRMELLAVKDGVYYVPDILLRMFLQRLMNPEKDFFRNLN